MIQSKVLRITLDGQGEATIDAPDARRPAVQVLGREVTIKGFTVTGGTFGIAINRGATVDGDDEGTAITNTKAWDDERTTLHGVQLRICSSH